MAVAVDIEQRTDADRNEFGRIERRGDREPKVSKEAFDAIQSSQHRLSQTNRRKPSIVMMLIILVDDDSILFDIAKRCRAQMPSDIRGAADRKHNQAEWRSPCQNVSKTDSRYGASCTHTSTPVW